MPLRRMAKRPPIRRSHFYFVCDIHTVREAGLQRPRDPASSAEAKRCSTRTHGRDWNRPAVAAKTQCLWMEWSVTITRIGMDAGACLETHPAVVLRSRSLSLSAKEIYPLVDSPAPFWQRNRSGIARRARATKYRKWRLIPVCSRAHGQSATHEHSPSSGKLFLFIFFFWPIVILTLIDLIDSIF